MAEDNSTLPPVNDGQPTIRSILLDNSNYLNDVVRTLETKIVPDVKEIRQTFISMDERAARQEQATEFAQAEASAEARRAANLQPQAEPQTSFGGSKIGGGLAGLGAAGAGLGAFFLALAGAEAIMTKFGAGDNLKNLLTNLAEGLSAFSSQEFIALGTVLAAGALFGSVGGPEEAMQAGVGIAAMGAGLAGFLIALSGADAVMGSFGGDGSTLKPLLSNIADALSVFDNQSLIALGGTLAAGAGLGMLFGVGKVVGANIGIVAIGAGISGFLSALAAGDWVSGQLGADGSRVSALLKNVGEGLSSLTTSNFVALGSLMGVGGALGALFPGALPGATAGIVAVGVGIAGFLGALSAADWVASKLGAQGENIGPLLTNIGEGLTSFADVPVSQMLAIGPALAGLAVGLTALLGQQGLASIVEGGIDALKGAWNWLTGNDDVVERKGVIATLVDELEPLKNLDLAEVDKLDKFSSSLRNFAGSMNELGDMDVGDIEGNIAEIAENISKALPVVRVMVKGGTIGDGFFDGYPEMNFGPEGEGGVLNPDLRLDELQLKVQQLRGVFDPSAAAVTNISNDNAVTNNFNSNDNAVTNNFNSTQVPVPVTIVPNVARNQVDPVSMAINAVSPGLTSPVNITNISNVGNTTDNSSTSVATGGGSGNVNVPSGRSYNLDQSFNSVQRPAYA